MSGAGVQVRRLTPFATPATHIIDPDQPAGDALSISCIMATRGDAFPARHAIECFLRQSYADRELVVISAVADCAVKALVERIGDRRIRFIEAIGAATVGDLRNAAIAEASGALVAIWDDDDLSHPDRLRWQVAAMRRTSSDACLLARLTLWWPERSSLAISSGWTWENTMVAKKSMLPPYPSMVRGGDTLLVAQLRRSAYLAVMDQPLAYCYIRHRSNLWGDAHFERLFDRSSRISPDDLYAREIEYLAQFMPMIAYRDDLAAANQAGTGASAAATVSRIQPPPSTRSPE